MCFTEFLHVALVKSKGDKRGEPVEEVLLRCQGDSELLGLVAGARLFWFGLESYSRQR